MVRRLPSRLIRRPVAGGAAACWAGVLAGVTAAFETVGDPTAAALSGRPTLLIGDAAVAIHSRVPAATIYDLGTAWFALTGLPMVYAVWAVRREVARERAGEIARLADAYAESRTWGNAHRDAVIDAAIAARPQPRAFYETYFETLRYRLDADARAGFARFKDELAATERSRVGR